MTVIYIIVESNNMNKSTESYLLDILKNFAGAGAGVVLKKNKY